MFTPLAPRKRGPSAFGARPLCATRGKIRGMKRSSHRTGQQRGRDLHSQVKGLSPAAAPGPVGVRGPIGQIMSQVSLFAPPVCAACAAPGCPGASDLASCATVVAVSAYLAENAPVVGDVGPVVLPVVVPVERAVLAAVAMRIASNADSVLPSCPACGRRLPCSGVNAVALLARVPARLAAPLLARSRPGLWCPICGRVVSPSMSPKVASRLRRFLAAA